ncbi:hypothetical protein CONLIGDRAFT_632907 [Coniochaeta ligniaria NRRL 30616]|uniref:Efficient mitochondria targeting-associated protein 19 n=1 Tax=Coniochaeta ligniaria NRRL 30616 TaxID=1408157 RepID=A0A1J7IM42_9PEZI|nr:hypothetical protein CONLIGDRAFT_632907 [Coniochaeta ligniaria NRRL 30616]
MASTLSWKDRVWTVWFAVHLAVILLVDAVPLYPAHLHEPPSSPLHFLDRLRSFYITTYNDPIMQWTPDSGHDNWIPFFFNFEIIFLLPTCLYAVYQHAVKADRKTGFTGSEELLYLVYAFVTGFTTLVCLNDVAYWDPAVYSAQDKMMFVFGLYGPYFAIPAIMFADMYSRLLRRLRVTEGVGSVKKTQ